MCLTNDLYIVRYFEYCKFVNHKHRVLNFIPPNPFIFCLVTISNRTNTVDHTLCCCIAITMYGSHTLQWKISTQRFPCSVSLYQDIFVCIIHFVQSMVQKLHTIILFGQILLLRWISKDTKIVEDTCQTKNCWINVRGALNLLTDKILVQFVTNLGFSTTSFIYV